MQSTTLVQVSSVPSKMDELRIVCDTEIPIQRNKIDSAMVSLRKSLDYIKSRARVTVQNQVELGRQKTQLRDAEDELVKALAVKTRKEAKRMDVMDSISGAKGRVEELKGVVHDHKAKKDEYAEIIYQQSQDLATREGENDELRESKEEIEQALLWYNQVLGFRIECGRGLRFIFSNINSKMPTEEYSFTIRHSNDTYTLLDCDPPLNGMKELIHELNKTNELFRFVRIMRGMFREVAASGEEVPQSTSLYQVSTTIPVSAPASVVSTNSDTESPSVMNEAQLQQAKKRVHRKRGDTATITSPGSVASLRKSPRLKARKPAV